MKWDTVIKCVGVLVCILTLYSISGNIFLSDNGESLNSADLTSLNRLAQYCHIHPPVTNTYGRTFVDNHNWILKHLTVTIRHGDRTAIHSLPGAKSVSHGGNYMVLDTEAVQHAAKLSNYKLIVKESSTATPETEESDISSALRPETAFRTPDQQLTQGQLTSKGFMQHVRLGQRLHSAYLELLGSVRGGQDLYVRSTKYVRTIQSVAGLLTSLLPSVGAPSDPVLINVLSNEEDEVMHGIGLRTSSHNVGASKTSNQSSVSTHITGEAEFHGSCAGAVMLAKNQRQAFQTASHIAQRLASIFGHAVGNQTVGEVADASMPSYCHGLPLPCAVSGAVRRPIHEQCLLQSDLHHMMAEADRAYCEKYTGDQGGKNATQLAIHPFMKEILTHLTNAAASSPDQHKVSIFSGHDTVIAPVLAALGVYKDGFCTWPAYASRIAFELWQPSEKLLEKGVSAVAAEDHHVKVVYNGVDITQLIPTCAAERAALRTKRGVKTKLETSLWPDSPLCSLRAFAQQIDGMVAPHSSIEEACKHSESYAAYL